MSTLENELQHTYAQLTEALRLLREHGVQPSPGCDLARKIPNVDVNGNVNVSVNVNVNVNVNLN